jgi:hypothetical protein
MTKIPSIKNYDFLWCLNLIEGFWHRSAWMQLTSFTFSIGYNQKLPWRPVCIRKFWNHTTVIVS